MRARPVFHPEAGRNHWAPAFVEGRPGRCVSSDDSRVSRPAGAFAHATGQVSLRARDFPSERDTDFYGVIAFDRGKTVHQVSLVAASVAALLASASALAQGSAQDDPLDYVIITATRANHGVRT